MNYQPVAAVGEDSHRFGTDPSKPLMLGGIHIKGMPGLLANSDGDVILHAVTNAVSGITGVNILGDHADRLCLEHGINDSSAYLKEALGYLKGMILTHLSVSIECSKPRISPYILQIKESLGRLLSIQPEHIGLTATSGEGLSEFGRGKGIRVICILSGSRQA